MKWRPVTGPVPLVDKSIPQRWDAYRLLRITFPANVSTVVSALPSMGS